MKNDYKGGDFSENNKKDNNLLENDMKLSTKIKKRIINTFYDPVRIFALVVGLILLYIGATSTNGNALIAGIILIIISLLYK